MDMNNLRETANIYFAILEDLSLIISSYCSEIISEVALNISEIFLHILLHQNYTRLLNIIYSSEHEIDYIHTFHFLFSKDHVYLFNIQ